MLTNQTFDLLLLLARPAAGKSEVINYLKHTPEQQRIDRFHVRALDEIDDFSMLWTWFEEDELLTKLSHPRLHSTADGYFTQQYLWDVLIERIELEYRKKIRDANYHQRFTTLVEFSRGSEHGGYLSAFQHLSADFARHAAILYIEVSWEESLRKNRKRFNPNRADSILEHGLSDEKMERLYKENDWVEVTSADPHFVTIADVKVPYITFDNSDDITTPQGSELGQRLETTLASLWQLYSTPIESRQ
jgi:hypothetical protein